jgi:hypothetical protein
VEELGVEREHAFSREIGVGEVLDALFPHALREPDEGVLNLAVVAAIASAHRETAELVLAGSHRLTHDIWIDARRRPELDVAVLVDRWVLVVRDAVLAHAPCELEQGLFPIHPAALARARTRSVVGVGAGPEGERDHRCDGHEADQTKKDA